MSEIKHSGIKGYALLAAFVALLLFVILVVYLYKYNNYLVPEDPMRLSHEIAEAAVKVVRA